MSISDIARQLSEFRGETDRNAKPDRLKKHLIRADILKSRSKDVRRYTQMTGESRIEAYLMFSEIVPMSFSEVASRQDIRLTVLDEAESL